MKEREDKEKEVMEATTSPHKKQLTKKPINDQDSDKDSDKEQIKNNSSSQEERNKKDKGKSEDEEEFSYKAKKTVSRKHKTVKKDNDERSEDVKVNKKKEKNKPEKTKRHELHETSEEKSSDNKNIIPALDIDFDNNSVPWTNVKKKTYSTKKALRSPHKEPPSPVSGPLPPAKRLRSSTQKKRTTPQASKA